MSSRSRGRLKARYAFSGASPSAPKTLNPIVHSLAASTGTERSGFDGVWAAEPVAGVVVPEAGAVVAEAAAVVAVAAVVVPVAATEVPVAAVPVAVCPKAGKERIKRTGKSADAAFIR
jgi:hypothetical protein